MAVAALAGLSVMSMLSTGFFAWNWISQNQVENDPAAPEPRRPPHIIFIMTDDLGFNDIGYHNPDMHTPTLDKLAAEGVKLENYYVQPICTPSRSQLITGRYQIHTGLQHSIIRSRQPNCLPFHMTTLPQRLQEAGYSTHMVGKWHLGFYKRDCIPTRRGFNTYLGSLTGSVDYYTYDSCDGPARCGYDLHEGETVAWRHRGKYSTHLYTHRVRKILKSHDPSAQPLFIFLSFQAVHTPLECPKEYIYPYRGMGNVHRRKYAGMVSAMDEAVRNVTYALRKYGYYQNSVIIFSTDNGGQPLFGGSNWPLRGRKGTYWEGGIRAVGFVNSPLLRQRGKVSKALIHITDWYPTLARLAGLNMTQMHELDGYDVWETISEGKESPRFEILHNIDPLYVHARHGSLQSGLGIWNTAVQAAVRMGDWKLLTGEPGYGDWTPSPVLGNFPGGWWNLERHAEPRKSVWLFNITADPFERYNMAEQRPDVVKQMLARLVFYNRTAVPVRYPAEDPRADPSLNGGVWRPWAGDMEADSWHQVYPRRRKDMNKKISKMKSFFKKLNTKIMSNRI